MDPTTNSIPTPNPTPVPNPNPNPNPNPIPAPGAPSTDSVSSSASGSIAPTETSITPPTSLPVSDASTQPAIPTPDPAIPVSPVTLSQTVENSALEVNGSQDPVAVSLDVNQIGQTIDSASAAPTPQVDNSNGSPAVDTVAQPGLVSEATPGSAPEFSSEKSFMTDSTNPVPSVSFADPAEQTEPNSMSSSTVSNKKKSNKTTLIILVVLAFMVVIALAAVLVFQLLETKKVDDQVVPENPTPSQGVTPNEDGNEEKSTETISCSRDMTELELAGFDERADSGSISINMEFENGLLTNIEKNINATSSTVNEEGNLSGKVDVDSISIENLENEDIEKFYLPVDNNGEVILDLEELRKNYESLDFTCEAL